ncbi:MAG: RnfABCDGE type electron transport complex subunit G [Lentisphaerae bacterium]|nr:RnfABCDGE type electron transport complex subunit G [Lentisphaerota bacterium]
MKQTLRLISVLTVICAGAGALLGWTNALTRDRIAAALREEKLGALRAVLPVYDNAPDRDTVRIQTGGREWTFYRARRNGTCVGVAFESVSDQGYGGPIAVMVGVTNGMVNRVEILRHAETPGLGARITERPFLRRFEQRSIRDTVWALRKDGGVIDRITAATISSRAVVDALKKGLDVYLEHKKEITEDAPPSLSPQGGVKNGATP